MLKVDNTTQATKSLQNIINIPTSSQTVCCQIEVKGIRLVVKRKRPLFKLYYSMAKLEFAEASGVDY
jgi:hypothetical protein